MPTMPSLQMIQAEDIEHAWAAMQKAWFRQTDTGRVRVNRRDLAIALQHKAVMLQNLEQEMHKNRDLEAMNAFQAVSIEQLLKIRGTRARTAWDLAYEIAMVTLLLPLSFIAGHLCLAKP